jgi:hypothetical protein
MACLEHNILPQLIVCPQTICPECGPILSLDETSSTVEEEFPQSLFLWFSDSLVVFGGLLGFLLVEVDTDTKTDEWKPESLEISRVC